MLEDLSTLSLALGIVGAVTYGLVQVIKVSTPKDWKDKTRAGQSLFTLLPIVLGMVLSLFSLEAIADSLSVWIGDGKDIVVPWSAAAMLGLFAGTFATQFHNVMRNRVKKLE